MTTHADFRRVQRIGSSCSGQRIVLPRGQQGLGEAIGASRVTTNRALRSLARDKLIRVEPRAVVVLAPELLARAAENYGLDGRRPGAPAYRR